MGINYGLPIKFKEWTKSFDELVQNRKVKECAYHGFWVIIAGSLIHIGNVIGEHFPFFSIFDIF